MGYASLREEVEKLLLDGFTSFGSEDFKLIALDLAEGSKMGPEDHAAFERLRGDFIGGAGGNGKRSFLFTGRQARHTEMISLFSAISNRCTSLLILAGILSRPPSEDPLSSWCSTIDATLPQEGRKRFGKSGVVFSPFVDSLATWKRLSPLAPDNADFQKKTTRKAWGRDHYFLKLYDEENSETYHSPANIRDHWNRLPEDERRKVCPSLSGKIDDTDKGRAVVESAVGKARKEKKTG